jgi:ABC-2 type transport system permease protein
MRQHETGGLADVLLAAPEARTRWAAAHVLIAAASAVAGLAVLGLAAGIGYGTPLGLVGTTLAYTPACLLFAGLAVALFGWARTRSGAPLVRRFLEVASGAPHAAQQDGELRLLVRGEAAEAEVDSGHRLGRVLQER